MASNRYSYRSRKSPQKGKHVFKYLLLVGVFVLVGTAIFLNRTTVFESIQSRTSTEVEVGLSTFVQSLNIQEYISEIFSDVRNDIDSAQSEEHVTVARIALVSDSHGDIEVFERTLRKVLADQVDLIFHLGDTVEAGELIDIAAIRDVLDDTGVPYEVIPGDHDYNWLPQYDLTNFKTVFGPERAEHRVFSFKGYEFVFFPNAAENASTDASVAWLQLTLGDLYGSSNNGLFLITSRPITNPYFSEKEDRQGSLILDILKQYDVKEIFSGDTHIFTRYRDQETQIPNTTVGASGSYKNPLPQYVLLDLYENGEYDVVAKPGIDAESFD